MSTRLRYILILLTGTYGIYQIVDGHAIFGGLGIVLAIALYVLGRKL